MTLEDLQADRETAQQEFGDLVGQAERLAQALEQTKAAALGKRGEIVAIERMIAREEGRQAAWPDPPEEPPETTPDVRTDSELDEDLSLHPEHRSTARLCNGGADGDYQRPDVPRFERSPIR